MSSVESGRAEGRGRGPEGKDTGMCSGVSMHVEAPRINAGERTESQLSLANKPMRVKR